MGFSWEAVSYLEMTPLRVEGSLGHFWYQNACELLSVSVLYISRGKVSISYTGSTSASADSQWRGNKNNTISPDKEHGGCSVLLIYISPHKSLHQSLLLSQFLPHLPGSYLNVDHKPEVGGWDLRKRNRTQKMQVDYKQRLILIPKTSTCK